MDSDSIPKPNFKKGITLNIQHIELLNIIESQSIEELTTITKDIYNLLPMETRRILSMGSDLETIKRTLFKTYQHSMLSYKTAHFTENKDIIKKHTVRHVINYTRLNKEYRKTLIRICKNNNDEQILSSIKKSMSQYYERLIATASNFMPVEYAGIAQSTYEEFEKLSQYIQEYDIINLDGIISYTSFMRLDNKPNTHFLKEALDFAHKHNKKVRVGSLICYFNMPMRYNELKATNKNKEYVKTLLSSYTTNIVKYIRDYETIHKTNLVEIIELLNEPLNRYEFNTHNPYMLRHKIWTKIWWKRNQIINDDNISPGWFKFINLNDVCELSKVIRKHLPEVKIMINECNLEDETKSQAFINEVIVPIQKYEVENNIKIIDIIGTQCHCNTNHTMEQIKKMISTLNETNIPIEITEFDACVVSTKELSEAQLNETKLLWQNNFEKVIININNNLFSCLTIWSISDKMNFMIDEVMNKELYRQGRTKGFVTNVFGGYYDYNMNKR